MSAVANAIVEACCNTPRSGAINPGQALAAVVRDGRMADDRVRALILVTGVRIFLAAECGAGGGIGAADLDSRRPGGTTVGGLAEVNRAVRADTGAGRSVKPRPRCIDVILLDAPRLRVGDDELLVVEDVRIIVVGDDA